ncbi:MAG: VanZ family protein [Calditrichaceae bacterium]|nr:VanZ family protein [Calditrichaceae bacterium]MBN2707858.1 VanZ family protein [Calditrichaceae bacterium]RQV94230.1 MAG: VanZ family protein [Calditrichota bacterium]
MIDYVLKNKWFLIFLGYTIFIIYGTTIPFRFSTDADTIQRNLDKLFIFFDESHSVLSNPGSDMVANILFFIPFGLFLFNLLYYEKERKLHLGTILFITLSGFILSTLVETIQIFSPRRTASVPDVITNTFGTLIGSGFGYYLYKNRHFHRIHDFIENRLKNPIIILMMVYSLFIFFIGLAPFNFNISPRFVSLRILHLKLIEDAFIEKPSNLFSIIFIFGPGGYIFTQYFTKILSQKHLLKSAVLAVFFGSLLCVFVEAGQLFVNSRSFSGSDVLSGITGVLYGTITYLFFHQEKFTTTSVGRKKKYYYLFIFFIINYVIFVVYKYLYPFHFVNNIAMIDNKLDFFLFNILSYAPSNRLRTLSLLTIKNIALFVPLGLISRELCEHFTVFKTRLSLAIITGFFVMAIKLLQIINQNQIPLLFDFFGITIGVLIGYYIWKEIRDFFVRVFPDKKTQTLETR